MKQILCVLAGIGLFAGAAAGDAQAQDASIAAIVNGQLITNGDVDNRASLLGALHRHAAES